MLDVLDYIARKNIEAVLISVDFEKAFARVEYHSMYEAFKFFRFGPKIIGWLKLLFQDFELCTVNAGNSSEYFMPTRGLFQGNPIAPTCFITLIEILAIKLRSNDKIKGIQVGNVINLLSQFVDDMDIYMHYDQRSWQECMSVLTRFEENSGLLVNYEKTTVYRIGALRHSNAKFYTAQKLIWTNELVNVLGVIIAHTEDELIQLNMDPIIQMEGVLKLWHHRGLSLFGKILVINSLVASQLVYRLAVLPPISNRILEKIKSLFVNFVWQGGKPKINWKVLTGLKKDRGAGLVDVSKKDHALKLAWIFHCKNDQELEARMQEALNLKIGSFIWECNLHLWDVKKLVLQETFWKYILRIWSKYHYSAPQCREEALAQLLWYNSLIRVGNQLVFYKQWFRAEIYFVAQILKSNGEFKTWEEVQNEYNIQVPYLQYVGLCKAIPVDWRKAKIGNAENYQQEGILTVVQKSTKKIAGFYNFIVSDNLLLFDYWSRWMITSSELTFDLEEFIDAIRYIPKLSIVVKLRSFQCRLLLGMTITNIQLRRFAIKNTEMCSFCQNERETLVHLFWKCKKIKGIWDWFNQHTDIVLTLKAVLFSVTQSSFQIVDALTLFAKYYIYVTRCAGKMPKVEGFFNYCVNVQNIEKIIAMDKGKLDAHKNKWSNLFS